MADVMDANSQLTLRNKAIPLVNNVLVERDVKDKSTMNSQQMKTTINLPKILKLLTDKHSKKLVERHKKALQKLVICYRDGIPLRDVQCVTEILNVCFEYAIYNSEYESAICAIIKTMRKPFLMEKISDGKTFLNDVASCLTRVGDSVVSATEVIKIEVSAMVETLYNQNVTSDQVQGYKVVSAQFLKAAIERSSICKSLVECFRTSKGFDSCLKFAGALCQLSVSRLNCDDMLSCDAASLVCSSLDKHNIPNRLVFLSIQILWNLLEYGSKEEVTKQLNCTECINALKATFIDRLKNCAGQADRQMRNDLLMICILTASRCPQAPFLESGFTKVLLLLASYPEVKSNSDTVKQLKLTSNEEDFEFKKLLFDMLIVLSNDPASVPILSEQRVVLALFSYIKPINNELKTQWSPAQFEELQLQAMFILCTIAPLCIDDYMMCQGTTRLLLLLEWCIGSDDYGGHGNSFHATGGRGNKRAQMRYCFRLFRSVCTHGDEQILLDLTDQNAIGEIVGILRSASVSTDENDAIDIEMQCDMLFILASLCDSDVHRKELFGEGGVDMLINYLGSNPKRTLSPLGHHKLMLATVDCVWSAVLGCFMNEAVFLEKEGIFLLLDLLEVCPENMRNLILGTTLDLCENSRALPHIKLWRGKNDCTIGQLLLNLWRNEEKNLGISRDSSGIMLDTNMPIMSCIQERQGIVPLPSSYPSPAVVDVSENTRAKIFSMFCKIGFNNVPGLETKDYVTLSIIERYLEFKTLEVWHEIYEELEQENIRPISPDLDCMNGIIETLEERVITVSSVQRMLVDAETNNNFLEEEECYEKIKESHRQEVKALADFSQFVQRTSDYSALQKAREKQLEVIEHSRLQSRGEGRDNELAHNTTESHLTTTTFSGRLVNVESTPAKIAKPHHLVLD